MRNSTKYDKILDALQSLLEHKTLQNISVSEIAHTAWPSLTTGQRNRFPLIFVKC